ncbi:exonuclease domain-containing protein [Robertkochia sediminum]|uniref:exonuclease domain-containing protein n=1 Tax=Robertkochia sediminum TaxID=2785326 RepID=UPI001933C719|nr:exonuclease domain-containing protein [Robertkochia sediminum]MBL7473939.1 DNA polymerase III subunit epsilon [Robertkochia sediminum]
MRFAIVDIETTGLAGRDNRVTEIAVVWHNGREKEKEFHSLVNPGVPISPFVTGLTGIDDGMVAEAPAFEELAPLLLDLFKDRVFVAHNVQFDYQVLRSEFKRMDLDFRSKKLCTVRWSRKVFPGLHSYSLGKLCASLDIPLEDRHRAKGDIDATVLLLERLLHNDLEEVYLKMVAGNSVEGTLPSLLPKEEFLKLPETPGVYYFKDRYGKVIYVGKAINIKKRVLGHFYDKRAREIAMCRETASLDFELSGSELMALLMESKEIKSVYPKYNRAQKRTNKGYALMVYKNRKGILQLGYNPVSSVPEALRTFFNVTECITELERLCIKYELCPRYTALQTTTGACNHFRVKKCKGICTAQEDVAAYNERVTKALEELTLAEASFVLVLKGRTPDENGLVLVDKGIYKGYGFLPADEQVSEFETFYSFIEPQRHNSDVMKLIRQYLLKEANPRVIFPEQGEDVPGVF